MEFKEYGPLAQSKERSLESPSVMRKRHIAKTISYRLVSTAVGFSIMWIISGSVSIGAAFGVAELVYKPIQYYIHERIWYKYIKYGLKQKK
jgi:uncharacterized membrane protein